MVSSHQLDKTKRMKKVNDSFYISVILIALGILWFVYYPSYQPLVFSIPLLYTLYRSYTNFKKHPESSTDNLEDLKISVLRRKVKEKKLKAKSRRREDLVRALRESDDRSKRKYWTVPKIIAVLAGLIFIVILLSIYPPGRWSPPILGLSFYEEKDGDIRLIKNGGIPFSVSLNDIYMDQISIPIQVALRSDEGEQLEVQKVEIYYPSGLKVKSTGDPIIDPKGRVLVYEHDLKSLTSESNFTPLKTIDTLIIPFEFSPLEYGSLGKDGVPEYAVVGSHMMLLQQPNYHFLVKTYVKGRPTVQGKFSLNPKLPFLIFQDTKRDSITLDLTFLEKKIFDRTVSEDEIVDRWTVVTHKSGAKITYVKVSNPSFQAQYLYNGDELMKVNLDMNKDGFTDHSLINNDGEIGVDLKYIMLEEVDFIDWKESAFSKQ